MKVPVTISLPMPAGDKIGIDDYKNLVRVLKKDMEEHASAINSNFIEAGTGTGALGTAAYMDAGSFLQPSNNLSDVNSATTALNNLSGVSTSSLSTTLAGYLSKSGNLSGLTNIPLALTNLNISAFAQTILDDVDAAAVLLTLGAGDLATQDEADLGLGTMAGETATDYLSKAGNLSGLVSVPTARGNLGLGSAATYDAGTGSGDIAVLGAGGLFDEARIPTVAVTIRNGCTLSNGTDSDHDIDITAGHRVSETDYQTGITLASGITKRLDAAWSAGDGNGGIDTGSVAADTTYHIWLISNGTTIDALFSLSATSPTMPSGYTLRARLGAVVTDGSSNILPFIQVGPRDFIYKSPVSVFAGSTIPNGGGTYTITGAPTGLNFKIHVNANTNTQPCYVRHPDADNLASVGSLYAHPYPSLPYQSGGITTIDTDSSGQVHIEPTTGYTTTMYMTVIGWTDINLQ